MGFLRKRPGEPPKAKVIDIKDVYEISRRGPLDRTDLPEGFELRKTEALLFLDKSLEGVGMRQANRQLTEELWRAVNDLANIAERRVATSQRSHAGLKRQVMLVERFTPALLKAGMTKEDIALMTSIKGRLA